jgi:hypothetical protein
LTARRTVRRTARRGAAVASIALDAISPAAVVIDAALSAARPAVSVAPAAVRLAAEDTVSAASEIAFVAFPSMFPTISADRVNGSGAGVVS